MGSEVVVTYKRKRNFSRSDHSYTNEVSKPKASDDIREHVGPGEESMLQNKDREVGKMCGAQRQDSSDCADKCKEMPSVVPDRLCLEASTSEEANKLDKERDGSLCDNLVTKRKLPPTLITFSRRAKRSKNAAPARPTEDTERPCSAPAPAPAAAMVVGTDNPPPTAQRESCGEMSKESEQRRRMLDVSPRGLLDIDCNQPPPDCGSDEGHCLEPPTVPLSSVASTSKLQEKTPALQLLQEIHAKAAARDKGKSIMDPQPAFTGTSSRNNYMQLFPEKPERTIRYQPTSFNPPNFHGVSMQPPHQMVDYRAFYPPSYQWPYVQPQPGLSFHDYLQTRPDQAQSCSRRKMVLDNMLSRARAVQGNRSSFLDKFNFPTTWSEEELDSLWIGVRRHGRGNWDAILADPRLYFPPWKTARDLAERWQMEQAQVFCGKPIPQPSIGPSANTGLGGPTPSYGFMANGWPGPLHPHLGEESSSGAGPMTGGLPHWLRTAVGVLPRPFDLTQMVGSSVCPQPWLVSGQRTEPHNAGGQRGKLVVNERPAVKEDELIIIPSDASSEETISDDRNRRSLSCQRKSKGRSL